MGASQKREDLKPVRLPGLRDRKKAQQRLDLIEVAVKLFRKRGYEAVRMEDIAAMANVSTKTIYNYFPAKRDILIEFLVKDRERSIGDFERAVENATGDPISDLLSLMVADIGDVTTTNERALWLDIMAVTVREFGDARYSRYRHMFTSYIEILLVRLQRDGKISDALDPALAAKVIHILHTANFDNFCTVKSLSVADAMDMAKAQLEIVLKGWNSEVSVMPLPRRRSERSTKRT